MKPKLRKAASNDGYEELLSKLKKIFIEGLGRIEQQKLLTKWQAGELISLHILKNKKRMKYGKNIYERLAKDMQMHKRTLQQCVRFYHVLPIASVRSQLNWTICRKLMTIPDKDDRRRIEKKIIQEGWSGDKLQEYLNTKRALEISENGGRPVPQLKFTRGMVDVFETIKDDDNENPTGLVLDFGFRQTVPLPEIGKSKEGEFIQVSRDGERRSAIKIDIKKDYIYTYKAQVKKVIDGDTIFVRFGVEFGIIARWKMRLRGIDCPEVDTPQGLKAKRFVEERLKNCKFIIIKTYKDNFDIYDRYLADVFYLPIELKQSGLIDEDDPQTIADKGTFLNQELLDAGLAKKF